ncbi:MAG TPA: beta-ketoacyl-[acyl-carrier-protein] synthase family protein, partial [Candidatus Sumerlaeota bacterium]|nr:beta-ketoacyl-[acyl-carrier-protein] synthase family protein [Candidatus Sumerlaeota bacterium]
GLPVLGRLTGWGIANDANHITGPARDGCGLIAAIQRALDEAQLSPDALGAFCAHGTGTPYNDAMELTALESVFGERRFPLFSIKGAIGHTLGAGGAIEVGVCLKALAERCVPPTTGLEHPEPRAEGRACGKTQDFPNGAILTTNSGFGGINAALILERA